MTHHLMAFSCKQRYNNIASWRLPVSHLDCDVGHPAVLHLLVLPVVVEVAPVLHVAITAVALELHGLAVS